METNFFRKIKQGAKIKGGKQGGEGDDKDQDDEGGDKGGKSLFGGMSMGDNKQGGLGKMNIAMNDNQGGFFKIDLPPGAKVIAIGGTADDYVRSLFAYYRI